jgi:glutaminase
VGGGIIAVLPGQLGLAVFSPLLDEHGNSERGVRVCRDFSRDMELHVMQAGHHVVSPIRSIYTLAQLGSKRQRSHATATELAKLGTQAIVLELQGDLDFHAGEIITRRLTEAAHEPRFAILDFHRVNEIHTAIPRLLVHADEQFQAREGSLVFSGVGDDHESFVGQFHEESKRVGHAVPPMFADLDLALEWCEEQIASAAQLVLGDERVELHQHEALRGLDDDQLARFAALVEHRHYPQGTTVVDAEHPGIELLLVMAGELSVNLVLSDGGTHRLATLAPGMLVGEMLLASHEPSVSAVQADTDVECLALTGPAIAQLRTDDPDLWSALLVNVVSIVGRRADKIRHELVLLAE